jgi:hypothetical protein
MRKDQEAKKLDAWYRRLNQLEADKFAVSFF